MGRPPNNGGPSFRFNPTEVAEMEAILQAHNTQVPSREVLVALSDKFSSSGDRAGKVTVHMKQVWNWFQNRRYALRAKAAKNPVKLSSSPAPLNNITAARNLPQALQHTSVTPCQATVRNLPQVLLPISSASAVPSAGQNTSDNLLMEYEARSTRDGAWYDVAAFISHRSVETTDPEVLVRFAGLGQEEDEWVNIRKHVRQRSLPCEASECVAVLPADLILCFQEGKDQALYYDAHVLDAQRRRHDVRGCRCRFLVRYDHDQSEEIVPLKKVCRRPETDYRMQQLAAAGNINRNKVNPEPHLGNTVIHPSSEAKEKLPKVESLAETKEQPKAAVQASTQPVQAPSTSATTAVMENSVNPAAVEAPATQPMAPVVTTTIPIALSTVSGATPPAVSTSNPSVSPSESGAAVTTTAMATVAESITSGATLSSAGSTNPVAQAIASEANLFTESATCPAVHSIDSGVTLSPFSPTETISQATSGALPFATSATNEADPVCDSQATATSEAVQVSDSQASAKPVSDSQATASGNRAVPVSDSQATAPGNEAVPVSDSQATASTNEAVPVSNSQGTATNEAVPVSDSQATASMDEDVPVSDSQATASMDEDVPVSDSQATASMDEDVPVSDSQATASMGEDVPVSDSQATASMVDVSLVSDSQATASMDEDVPVSDSQAAISKNEPIPGNDSQTINDPITPGVTLSAATSTTPAGEFIDPGAIVTAAPVTPSMTSGASALPTAHDADTAIQLSYSEVTVSLVPGTVVTDSITAEASLAASTTTPVVQPIDMVPTVTAPHVTHSTTSGGPASTATQDAICSLSGSATSAVTISSALVPNLSVAGATDSVGTDTITAVSIPVNEAGASDSILPATAPTANSDDLVVADTASIAGSCVSEVPEITDSVAVEED